MFEILNLVYRQYLTYQSQPLPRPKPSFYCFAAIPLDISLLEPNIQEVDGLGIRET